MYRNNLSTIVLLAALYSALPGIAQAGESADASLQAYRELLEMSLKDKQGLTFFVNGQSIGGAVTRIDERGFVEVRNQEYGRILIRLSQVDALAAN
jgi:hypothetical protein